MKRKLSLLAILLALFSVSSWAGTYYLMQNNRDNKGTQVAQFEQSTSPYTYEWQCDAVGTYYFYVTKDNSASAASSCDYLNAGKTFGDGVAVQLYLYGGSNYEHSIKLEAPRIGVYTFTFVSSDPYSLTCTYPEDLTPAVGREFDGTEKLYFNAAGGPNWWAGVDQTAYLKDMSNVEHSVAGTNIGDNIYEFVVPVGTYKSLYIQRGTWNKTGNILLAGTEANNYISVFAENSADVTWDNYNPSAAPEPIVYSIKTNWKDGGWDAGFKALTVNDDGSQSIEETYTGNGFNISPSFLGTDWYPVDKLNLVGGVAVNDLVTISVNPNATSQEEVFTITKISSPEPEPELDPINVTVRVYTTAAAPKIWWWGGDIAGADATYTWDGRPSMNKEGETNWYSWTFEGVNATTGISYKITATQEKEFSGVKEDKCLDANLNDFDCSYVPEPEPEPEPTLETNFYLVGTFNGWNTTSHNFVRQNLGDEVAYTTIAGVHTTGDIAFKVMEDSQWCNATTENITIESTSVTFRSDDSEGYQVKMTPYAAGDYVVALNLTTRVLTVTYPAGEKMEETHEIALAGTFNSWGEEHPAFTKNSLTSYTVTQHLEASADNYEFRVIVDGSWVGANYTIKREYCTDVELNADQNFKLLADITGDYIFDYNPQTNRLTVTYPAQEFVVNLTADGYASFCWDKNWTAPADVIVYIATSRKEDMIFIEEVSGVIPAGKGVILKAAGAQVTVTATAEDATSLTDNILDGTTAEISTPEGTIYALHYVSSVSATVFDQYLGAKIPANKAYLNLGAAAPARLRVVMAGNTTTGLLNGDASLNAVASKRLVGGQLIILRDGKMYNVQGVQL